MVVLAGVVTRVELSLRQRPMSGYAKQQAAVRMALGGGYGRGSGRSNSARYLPSCRRMLKP